MITPFLNRWTFYHSLAVLLAAGWYWGTGALFPLVAVLILSLTLISFIAGRRRTAGYWLGGPGNWLTWLRLLLTAALLLLARETSPAWLAALALLEVSLDGFDGALARRFGTASRFGEYLDKETDALFVLVMTVILYEKDYAGGWILWPGLLRFLYALPEFFLRPPAEKDPRTRYGRIIAGILMVGLPVALIAPAWLYRPALPALSLLLAWSFLRSFAERVRKSRPDLNPTGFPDTHNRRK